MDAVILKVVMIIIGYAIAVDVGLLTLLLADDFRLYGLSEMRWFRGGGKELAIVVFSYGAWIAMGLTLPIATALIVATEWFALRSIFIDALAGMLVGAFHYFRLASSDVGDTARHSWPDLAMFASAGLLAGVVYWAIAGRNAGNWRTAPATA